MNDIIPKNKRSNMMFYTLISNDSSTLQKIYTKNIKNINRNLISYYKNFKLYYDTFFILRNGLLPKNIIPQNKQDINRVFIDPYSNIYLMDAMETCYKDYKINIFKYSDSDKLNLHNMIIKDIISIIDKDNTYNIVQLTFLQTLLKFKPVKRRCLIF